jgi:hypothetical protein
LLQFLDRWADGEYHLFHYRNHGSDAGRVGGFDGGPSMRLRLSPTRLFTAADGDEAYCRFSDRITRVARKCPNGASLRTKEPGYRLSYGETSYGAKISAQLMIRTIFILDDPERMNWNVLQAGISDTSSPSAGPHPKTRSTSSSTSEERDTGAMYRHCRRG